MRTTQCETGLVAGREIPERHLERTADLRFEVVHGAGKTVRRQPLRKCVGLDEGAVDFQRTGGENAVQVDSAGHGVSSSL